MAKSAVKQSLIITKMGMISIKQRWIRTFTTIVGIVGVVVVFVSLLSIAEGYKKVMNVTRSSDSVIIFMKGANSELVSSLTKEQVSQIRLLPEIERSADREPLLSAEVLTITSVKKKGVKDAVNVSFRGVESPAFALRKDLKIEDGRVFNPGSREIIVGTKAQKQFDGLKVGSTYQLGDTSWKVVGMFSAGGSVTESEIWTATTDLQAAQKRGTRYQTLYTKLADGVDAQKFAESANEDPRISIKAVREDEYYGEQSEDLNKFVNVLGYTISLLMGFGATFAALNANYANVISRVRELATYKALGFKDEAIVIAVVLESAIMGLIGGLLGTGVTYSVFDGYTASTLLMSKNHSQVVFAFDVSSTILLQAGLLAGFIGILGGLFPAIQTVRLPVSKVLASRK
jgi:putative ABC transport system permease protein